jgi:uncharacterized protein (TIRG00374 family)
MRRWALAGFAVGMMAVVFVFLLPRFADYGQAWDSVRRLSWGWVVVLAVCAALDLATFAPPWQVALPGLRFWPALAVTQASTAASLVTPAGSAVGIAVSYQQLRRRGYSGTATGRAVSLTSLWSQLANLAYPVVAVALLAAAGHATAILAPAAILGAGLFAVAVLGVIFVAASDRLATRTGDTAARAANRVRRVVHRSPVRWGGPSFERFRLEAVDLLRSRWLMLSVTTLANGLATLLTLTASLRALGVPASRVSLVEVFAAWALGRLVGSIEITPGGFGVFELSLTAALVGFGGPSAGVLAAVLLYRALTVIPTLATGLFALAISHASSRSAPSSMARDMREK